MNKKVFLTVACVSVLAQSEDFITPFEYGQMLYQKPRGVSCVPCHGETGEGREIARYTKENGDEVIVRGPDIRSSSIEAIKKSAQEGRGVMPRYHFTDDEIKTIHAYLKAVNSPEES